MPSDIAGTIDAVVKGVGEGRYSEDRINASVRRVLRLKAQVGLPRHRFVSIDSVRAVVGDSAHVSLANTIAERGIVLAKDSLSLVPLRREERPRVLSVTYARRNDLGAGVVFNAELRRGGAVVAPVYVDADAGAPDLSAVLAGVSGADVVVVGSYVNISSSTATATAPTAFAALVSELLARTPKVILVTFGTPYLLLQAPSVPGYMIAWGPMNATQRATARALVGSNAITARLPVSIPPLLPLGAGETRPARSAP
jgi:beta-N-acetylhexosaminidase